MRSSRPYLVRALYEWIVDNDCTPHMLVDATRSGVDVPPQFVKNGQIVLNIAPRAVSELVISNEDLRFRGRFAGVAMDVYVPIDAVLGIYARENGQGMLFADENDQGSPPPDGDSPPPSNKPQLRVVK